MARTYLIFGDIEGKLDVLRVECTKCDRKGLYLVRRREVAHHESTLTSEWSPERTPNNATPTSARPTTPLK